MASGESPASARRRVRLEVRRAREARNLTQQQVADAMDWSLSKVMRIESGEVKITTNDLKSLLTYLGIVDQAWINDLIEAAKTSRGGTKQRQQQWWDQPPFRDGLTPAMRQLIQFEADATAFRYFYTLLVPGQLQTPEYARAVVGAYVERGLERQVADIRLRARERRHQQLVNRADPPKIYALMDEAVLYRRVAGADVLAAQLDELLRLVEQARLLIRIVPFDVQVPIPTLGVYEIIYLDDDTTADAEDHAVMYRESDLSDEIVDNVTDIRQHRENFERLWNSVPEEGVAVKRIVARIAELRGEPGSNTTPG